MTTPIEQYEGETYQDDGHFLKCLCWAILITATLAGIGFIGWWLIRSVAQ